MKSNDEKFLACPVCHHRAESETFEVIMGWDMSAIVARKAHRQTEFVQPPELPGVNVKSEYD